MTDDDRNRLDPGGGAPMGGDARTHRHAYAARTLAGDRCCKRCGTVRREGAAGRVRYLAPRERRWRAKPPPCPGTMPPRGLGAGGDVAQPPRSTLLGDLLELLGENAGVRLAAGLSWQPPVALATLGADELRELAAGLVHLGRGGLAEALADSRGVAARVAAALPPSLTPTLERVTRIAQAAGHARIVAALDDLQAMATRAGVA